MTVTYLTLTHYVGIAAQVTGLSEGVLKKVAQLDLADSALHAPAAGFEGNDFYPDLVDKAAVPIVRLAKNHPLPDGNKRVAWVALRYFLIVNDLQWNPRPSVDEAEAAVLAIAAGDWDERRTADWLRTCIKPANTT